jgi:hypothetical protein
MKVIYMRSMKEFMFEMFLLQLKYLFCVALFVFCFENRGSADALRIAKQASQLTPKKVTAINGDFWLDVIKLFN